MLEKTEKQYHKQYFSVVVEISVLPVEKKMAILLFLETFSLLKGEIFPNLKAFQCSVCQTELIAAIGGRWYRTHL